MKLKNLILTSTLVLFASIIFAQENQHQKAIAMGAGDYTRYPCKYDDGKYTFEGISSDPWKVKFEQTADGQIQGLQVSRTSSGKIWAEYYPDHEAFTVNFKQGGKYTAKSDALWFKEDKRVVFMGDFIYLLEDYKDQDSWKIDAVIAPGTFKGIKAMKESLNAKKKMEAIDHVANIKTYFAEGYKKQAEMIPAWESENADMLSSRQAELDRINAQMVTERDSVARVLAAREDSGPAWLTIKNDTGKEIGIYTSFERRNLGGYGSTMSVKCSQGDVHVGSNESGSWEKGSFIFNTENVKCGETVLLSKYF